MIGWLCVGTSDIVGSKYLKFMLGWPLKMSVWMYSEGVSSNMFC